MYCVPDEESVRCKKHTQKRRKKETLCDGDGKKKKLTLLRTSLVDNASSSSDGDDNIDHNNNHNQNDAEDVDAEEDRDIDCPWRQTALAYGRCRLFVDLWFCRFR